MEMSAFLPSEVLVEPETNSILQKEKKIQAVDLSLLFKPSGHMAFTQCLSSGHMAFTNISLISKTKLCSAELSMKNVL